jgi:diacylglycerol kinase family enzyme
MGRLGAVRMLRHLRSTMADRPDVRGRAVHRRHDLTELVVTSARPQDWQLDGDHLGPATALRVRSIPDALEVVV